MDIIKLKEKKRLGKYKCSCGLVVRLYETDIEDYDDASASDYGFRGWKCPCCDKVNHFHKEDQIGLKGFLIKYKIEIIISLTVLSILSAILIPIISNTVHMNNKYDYSFKYRSRNSWYHGYTNDDMITEISTLPTGFEFHSWTDKTLYARGVEEIKEVRRN